MGSVRSLADKMDKLINSTLMRTQQEYQENNIFCFHGDMAAGTTL